jgi:isopenicillin N synthase-like dioxygenase
MLDRMTRGIYRSRSRSTPHRVRNLAENGRLSFPFFYDPNWEAIVKPIECDVIAENDSSERWDGANVHDWNGTYGDYILNKVSRVFPDLNRPTD